MSKKQFNPDLELIAARIEAAALDIAPTYPDWRDLGFALADALGEAGRTYYHRLSCFYPSYSQTETDHQYTNCLKAHGHGITIKTLYHLAKTAGVEISKSPNLQNGDLDKLDILSEEPAPETLPTIPESIYPLLPDFLKLITTYSNSPEDADLLLLGSLTVISACLPNVYGIYGGVTIFPNLFLFVSAQASAGKGRLSLCRRLVESIHRQLRELNRIENEEYKAQKAEYQIHKKKTNIEQPEEPPLRVLFIPANSSATALFQILSDNNEVGLMFETEGDTLAQTLKTEHGNYSDGFRKAFHHEKISYLRRKDREYVTLEEPKLSALLSGTPRQLQSLIPDAENGLFSRFMYYHMNIRLQWINVFADNENRSLDSIFNNLGDKFFEFYLNFKKYKNIRFFLTDTQQNTFNQYFEHAQQQYFEQFGNDYVGTVRRLALITFRITMILSTLRLMDTGTAAADLQSVSSPICSLTSTDSDFQTAMQIAKTLIQHAAFIFKQLPQPKNTQTLPTLDKKGFYNALPLQFDRNQYIETAKTLNIPESTADKQISRFMVTELLTRQAHGVYQKNAPT